VLTLLKSKLILYGGAVLVALLGVIKYLSFSRGVYKNKAKRAEITLKRQSDTQDAETEIDQKFSRRAKESNKDIEDGKVPDHLSKPR